MYADYTFYSDTYLGDIIPDETAFKRAARDAELKLDYFTFGRIDQADNKIRLAVCKMADILYTQEQRQKQYQGREVASENNDGYSISFAGLSEQERQRLVEKELYDAAYTCLSQTGLMDWSDGP